MELIIPISRFRKAFDVGTMAVDVLMQEVEGNMVRIALDEGCSQEDVDRYASWCVEKARAREFVFDPLNPAGQLVMGNPQRKSLLTD
jgi:hypothetical protein